VKDWGKPKPFMFFPGASPYFLFRKKLFQMPEKGVTGFGCHKWKFQMKNCKERFNGKLKQRVVKIHWIAFSYQVCYTSQKNG
jgi:hypothetical protein